MDLKKYDELRKKISTKDFEGNNKGLDKWLYSFSFVGNLVSIFFAYFLLYPALLKAISINLVSGMWGTVLAFIFANTFLIIFEIVKRYLFRNFSSDFVASGRKISASLLGWLTISLAIISLSFFLSLVGAKNLASTSSVKNTVAMTTIDIQKDNLAITYENKKKVYEVDNQALRNVNNDLRNTLAQTPINYATVRRDYQESIDKNTKIIESNQAEINKIDEQLKQRVEELKTGLNKTIAGNATEDTKNIFLFIIIAIFAEAIIIGGVYFREWYEYNLYVLNQQKFEKIYQKKDRYRSLLSFVYKDGKLTTGDRVISGMELKEIVAEKTTLQNSNKLVDEFLKEMDNLGIFSTTGKRRFIVMSYNEAQNVIEHFDDAYRALENIK